jgi:cytochrome P450
MGLAVEEMLRFVTPVMHHSRWPLRDVTLEGKVIEAGTRTTLWMVSANRDDKVFVEPDRFDVTRDPNRHDSLGAGPPFLLGRWPGAARSSGPLRRATPLFAPVRASWFPRSRRQ